MTTEEKRPANSDRTAPRRMDRPHKPAGINPHDEKPMASGRSKPPGDFADQNRFDHDPLPPNKGGKRDSGCGCGS